MVCRGAVGFAKNECFVLSKIADGHANSASAGERAERERRRSYWIALTKAREFLKNYCKKRRREEEEDHIDLVAEDAARRDLQNPSYITVRAYLRFSPEEVPST